MHSDYGTTFDGKDECSFGNDNVRNVVIFNIDNSSSSHADNRKNNFLVLDKGDTFGINGSFGVLERKFSINFSKGKTKFCFSLHYNGITVICLLTKNKSLSLKLIMETSTLPLYFAKELYIIDLSLKKYL